MLDRLKDALVESYVGTVLVGWLFAEGLIHAVGIFTAPLTTWEARTFVHSFIGESGSVRSTTERFPWWEALPQALSAALLLIIAYRLLRWLYYKTNARQSDGSSAVT